MELAARFGARLRQRPDLPLADVCFAAGQSRARGTHRLAALAHTTTELSALLARRVAAGRDVPGVVSGTGEPAPVAFLFTGQGAQQPGVGRARSELYPVFRDALDRSARLLDRRLSPGLLEVLFGDGTAGELIHRTDYT